AAAVLASNLVLGIAETAIEELVQCGFTKDGASKALIPFIYTNAAHLLTASLEESLTGPVERSDEQTVEKHLQKLTGDDREIYRLLSKKALTIARRKNPGRNYEKLEQILT
ncbi:MAG: DUF2520 domain-containing protein, partial [Lachnospiraceae bacterium]